ncbi:hypothetical protein [Peribacillus muralis]|uniref:hypothetical protein n=1 Tax=Peribacillus muralis TaxID=264697 RepID=UPI0036730C53
MYNQYNNNFNGGNDNMFGSAMGGMMGMNKGQRVADAIDAKVQAGKLTLQNAEMSLQQLDFIENQLTQMAQQLQAEAPMVAMQFQSLVQQLNNSQGQVVNAVRQASQIFTEVDGLTDKIQN